MTTKSNFKFDMGDVVTIEVSRETGTVEARTEYKNGTPNQYFIRYVAADGRAAENWWEEGTLALGNNS